MAQRDEVCGVLLVAISIKEGIYYNINKDKIDGFEDLGSYGKADKTANYVMVFMAKRLASKWKQTLGYILFSKNIRSEILKQMIDCITKLKDTGLIPKFVICDRDVTNRSVCSKLNISHMSPYTIHNQKVYFFYDTPHLLKMYGTIL